MIKSTCEVQISRIYGAETHAVEIRLMDKISRTVFAEVLLTLEEFSQALFGTPSEGVIEYRGLNKLGTRKENKVELLLCDPWNQEQRHRALRIAETDGWKARHGDIDNHHNFVRGQSEGVRVVFFRNVGKSYVEQERENDSQS